MPGNTPEGPNGTWTAEQDAELAALINVNGTAWSKIAGIINRHPEDIRDRYRNYIVCGANQRRDVWGEEEEAKLTEFVQEAMVAIDELRNEAGDDPDSLIQRKSYEELIEWQNVARRWRGHAADCSVSQSGKRCKTALLGQRKRRRNPRQRDKTVTPSLKL